MVATRNSSTSRPLPTAERLARAVERRAPLLGSGQTDAVRLVHGVADGLPGLAVDAFGDTLVVHADSAEALDQALPALRSLPGYRRGYTKLHPPQASRLDLEARRRLAPDRPAWGDAVDAVVVVEDGAAFEVRPGAGLSVGLFLDMRQARRWVGSQARGRSVLNLFAYTCAFGVRAALGGAARVLTLDASRPLLGWGQANYAHNGLSADPRDFVFGDAFDWLRRLARRGERFDLVIVDPPSFSSTRAGAFSAQNDYPRLAALAARVVAPGGMLLAATNHAGIGASRFDALLGDGLAEAAREARPLARFHEPTIDFPIAPGRQAYLKVRVLRLDPGRPSHLAHQDTRPSCPS